MICDARRLPYNDAIMRKEAWFMPGIRYMVHPLGADTYAIEEKTPVSQGYAICCAGGKKRC